MKRPWSATVAVAFLLSALAPSADAATAGLGIDVTVLDCDGDPIDQESAVTIWKQVEAGSEPNPRARRVVNPNNQAVWQRVTGSISGVRGPTCNGKDRFLTNKDLQPGVYRVTVFVGSRQENMLGMATSKPIRLDGSKITTPVTVSVEDGPPVTFVVLDTATRIPLDYPSPGIRLTRPDGFVVEWDPLNPYLYPGKDGKYRIEHLAPGSYRVDVSAESYAYGYPNYELTKPMSVKVHEGEASDFVLELARKPVDEEEAKRRWPWAVQGVVTDSQDNPIEGAEIRAARGYGTLFNTMPVYSDKDGRYLLRFGPGMMIINEETGRGGAGIQAALISARKPGHSEKTLGRQGGLLMADAMPDKDSNWDRKKIILPSTPYRVDFVLVRGAKIEGKLVDEQGDPLAKQRIYLSGDSLSPGSSVDDEITTDAEGHFQLDGITPGFKRWFELDDDAGLAMRRTQSLRLEEGEHYQIVLQITTSATTGRMLRVNSAKGSQAIDVLDRVIRDDPRARPFVDEGGRSRCREDGLLGAGWQERGRGRTVKASGETGDQVVEQVSTLLAAGRHNRQDALDEATASFAVGAVTHLAPTHRHVNGSFAFIIGRLNAHDASERPKMFFLFEHSFADSLRLGAAAFQARLQSPDQLVA